MKDWKVWLKQNETHIIQAMSKGDRKTGCGVHTTVIWNSGFVNKMKCRGILYPGDTVSFRAKYKGGKSEEDYDGDCRNTSNKRRH